MSKRKTSAAQKPRKLAVGQSWASDSEMQKRKIEQHFSNIKHGAYKPPAGVVPDNVVVGDSVDYGMLNSVFVSSDSVFMGYPLLATLAQKSENRVACEQSVNEVFRKGFKVKSNDTENDRSKIIGQIEDAFEKYAVEKHLKLLGFNAEAFGNSFLFVKMKGDENERDKELLLDPTKIKKGDLEGFRVVEPMWTYPQAYNAIDPISPDFFVPQQWYVMGRIVSASRMKSLVLYSVPDMLKPSYNFGGLSLIQMMLPYVTNWESVRDDIPRIITSFRTYIWSTDMETYLQDRNEFDKRLDTLVYGKDNHGVLAIDKAQETLEQMNTSLTGLHELQAEMLRLICVPSRLSVTSLTGSQPSGMNASGEGERESQHENISNKQKNSYKPVLDWVLKILCLNEFGEFYEDLYIDFNPLDELSDLEIADINNKKADTYVKLIDAEVVTPEQVCNVIAADDDSEFNGIKYEVVSIYPEGDPDEDKDPSQGSLQRDDSKSIRDVA
ncbi:TPA: DUF1073 domain-containing protein [Citrobacter braakii]